VKDPVPVCYHCGKEILHKDVVELKTVCPWCGVDITVCLCPKCAEGVVNAIRMQLKVIRAREQSGPEGGGCE